MRNIYLIGMMGAGKTATGRALAKLLQMDFLDLDEEIESRAHLTINEIFQKKGEAYFRGEEKRMLDQAARETNTVVATGGGIVLDPGNVDRMRATGRVIYLAAPFDSLWERVQGKRDRPLLAAADPKAVFFRLFQEREPLYERSGHARVPTEGLSPEAVAREMKERYLK